MGQMPVIGAGVPLVGRDTEIGVLRAEVERAWSGVTRCVLIGGEAGIGKTRLASALVDLAGEVDPAGRVVWGHCVDLGADAMPYTPFLPVIRTLTAELGGQGLDEALGTGRGELARLLPDLGPSSAVVESEVGRGRLFEAIARLCEHAAAERPLVVVLEDLHWADASTRELVSFLVRTLEDARVLLAVTYRADEMHRRHPLRPLLAELERHPRVSRLDVSRLRAAQVEEMLASLRDESPTPAAVVEVVERSGGVPFYVEELAARAPGQALPNTLRDLLLLRVGALSTPAQRVLAAASVGGTRVTHTDLADVTDLDPGVLDAALREAVDAHLLLVDRGLPGYAFRHALLREAVLDDLLPGQEAALQERWAQVLQQRLDECGTDAGLAVRVAHHWYAALDLPHAFTAALTAADAAAEAHAPQEELVMLERALHLWDRVTDPDTVTGGDRAALLERAGEVAFDAGDEHRMRSLFTAAVAEVDPVTDPQRHAGLLIHRLRFSHTLSATELHGGMERALALIPPDVASSDRAWALFTLAWWHGLHSDGDAALEFGTRARAEARRACAPDIESRVVSVLAFAQVQTGAIGLDSAVGLLEEARQLAVESGSERALGFYRVGLSAMLMELGRFTDVLQVCAQGRERAHSHGLVRTETKYGAVNEALALIALGRWDDALDLTHDLLAQTLPSSVELFIPLARAEVLVRRGDPAAADAVAGLDRMTDWFPGEPQLSLQVGMVRAEHALALGDPHTALATLLEAVATIEGPLFPDESWQALHTLARAIISVEQTTGEVQQQARAILARARQFVIPSGIRQVWDAVLDAELTPGDDAEQRWATAYRELTEPAVEGLVHLRAYTGYRFGAALLQDGRRDEAAPVLADALERARALRAAPLEADITAVARRGRIRLPGVDDSTSVPAGAGVWLTPREHDVLALVTAGRTNAQIAGELFISPKTVSVHVSNILAKLGATSRAEATTIAHRDRLIDPQPTPDEPT
jgi:DNA-binding CsgD family transcriptional regulator